MYDHVYLCNLKLYICCLENSYTLEAVRFQYGTTILKEAFCLFVGYTVSPYPFLSFSATIPESPYKRKGLCGIKISIFASGSACSLTFGPGLWMAGAAKIPPLEYS